MVDKVTFVGQGFTRKVKLPKTGTHTSLHWSTGAKVWTLHSAIRSALHQGKRDSSRATSVFPARNSRFELIQSPPSCVVDRICTVSNNLYCTVRLVHCAVVTMLELLLVAKSASKLCRVLNAIYYLVVALMKRSTPCCRCEEESIVTSLHITWGNHKGYCDWGQPTYCKCAYQTTCEWQVNVSELGLVTPAGKVVWGESWGWHWKTVC